MSGVPILVDAAQLVAVVVGGGAVGARKALALLDAGATVRVVSPEFDGALRAAGSPRLTLVERPFEPRDLADADLVFAATSSRAVNQAVAAAARALHRLVTVADAPHAGTFGGMAVHRAGEVVVAVSAGGVPGAAVRIRDAAAAVVGPEFGAAVDALSALRDDLLGRGERARWREASAALAGAGFCDEVRAGRLAARVAEWR